MGHDLSLKRIHVILALSALLFLSLSCGSGGNGTVALPAMLTGLTMLPKAPIAAVGAKVQFQVIGAYSDNSTQDLSSQVSWSSSNTTIATITSTGLAAVLSAGTTTITAASGSLAASATLTGMVPTTALTGLSVTPSVQSADIGTTMQFLATGTYADNTTQDLTNQVTWSSTNTTVATIGGTGLASVVGSGITTISAATGSVSGSATLTALGSAKVLLYATDDISTYPQVIATINKVRLVSSSANVTCDVLSPPVTLNIANLANDLQLIASSTCPTAQYNRIDIEFAQSIQLMDNLEKTSSCKFVSYLDYADQPNALQCDPTTNTCTLEILGAVRSGAFDLLSTEVNKLALDFDLRKFTVRNFGDPLNCAASMKVLPLHKADIILKGFPEVIAGSISNLDAGAQTFILTSGNVTTNVNYASLAASNHPGIALLLQTAQANGIRVLVSGADLAGLNTNTINASDIAIKLEGTVSNLVTTGADHTFTLTYTTPASNAAQTMTILSAPPAGHKHGNLLNGAWVEVRLYGYDSTQAAYLSSLVDVQTPGTKTAN